MAGTGTALMRGLPTHFVTLWSVDLPSRHGGRVGDLGWALLWVAVSIAVAGAVIAERTRTARQGRRAARPGSRLGQLGAAARAAWRDDRRNPVQWVLNRPGFSGGWVLPVGPR
jgi:hypothetical protein